MDTQTTYQRTRVRTIAIACAVLLALFAGFFAFTPPAHAEGTRDLVANGGYRPYTERYNATTLGQQRQSVTHVYLKAGETVCLGTSVANAKLYNISNGTNTDFLFSNSAMGKNYSNAQLTYINTTDIAYTVDEETVDGYTTQIGEVLGSADDSYMVTITNTYDPTTSAAKTVNTADTSDFTYQIIAAIVAIIVITLIMVIIAHKRSKKHDEEALSHRKH